MYSGAVQFYFGDRLEQVYAATVRAVTDASFLALPAQPFAEVFRQWYPMAVHLLEGLFIGQRNLAEMVGQRERLLALGKLTAGLTHELNNPAAAAARATAALRDRFAGMRHKLALLVGGKARRGGAALADRAAGGVRRAHRRGGGPLRAGAVRPRGRARRLARGARGDPAVGAGRGVRRRRARGRTTSSGWPTPSRRRTSSRRCAGWPTPSRPRPCWPRSPTAPAGSPHLVDAAKQYSQMDRTPHQQTDLHAGLDATLVMLGAKIPPGVTVVKEYDRSLPPVPAYAGELNQVWTNLIVNALDAMARRRAR